jgi:hypothetical protein
LEHLTKTGVILTDSWEIGLEAEWHRAIGAAVQDLREHGEHPSAPEDWDGYEIKLARLRKAAGRLHELLLPLGDGVELVTECPLSAADGRLQGRPDLLVRAAGILWLVDYKTGAVISRETLEPRESYVRQLLLYAYLVSESLGAWPERAVLVPLQGAVVDVPIDPAVCTELAAEALELLASFNAATGGSQPPQPHLRPVAGVRIAQRVLRSGRNAGWIGMKQC